MPCYHPLTAWLSKDVNPSGKRSLVFKEENGKPFSKLEVPCGQCIGCRLEKSRQWAVRCVHEASLYDSNCFITLTYNDESLPLDGGLRKEDFQKFMKRFRKAIAPRQIRFFHCGEYGELTRRPHYHACIFNFDFPDKVEWSTRDGVVLYRSPFLEKLWPFGNSSIGEVTFESAAYVARYVTKKVTGDAAENHYSRVDSDTGEVFQVSPEYCTMSRRPHGIGYGWYEKYASDAFPKDFITIRGARHKPPRYYGHLYEISNSEDYEAIKRRRMLYAIEQKEENTQQRLQVRETVKYAQFKQLKRGLD